MWKLALKIIWFGFGAAGLFIIIRQYYPNFPKNLAQPGLVKGIQSELSGGQPVSFNNLMETDPTQAAQIIGKILSQEITKTLTSAGEEVKEFPAKQVKKVKIGACESLLEEDICSVAKEIECR